MAINEHGDPLPAAPRPGLGLTAVVDGKQSRRRWWTSNGLLIALTIAVASIALGVALRSSALQQQVHPATMPPIAHEPVSLSQWCSAATSSTNLEAVQFVVNNDITMAAVRVLDGSRWLYFWHPNATDASQVVPVDVRPINPVTILDVSPSMQCSGFLDPAYSAVAESMLAAQRIGEERKHLTQGRTAVERDTTFIAFSSDARASRDRFVDPAAALAVTTLSEKLRQVGFQVHTSGTAPEAAFDELLRRLRSEEIPRGGFVPVLFLTDGQFNGGQDYPAYWRIYAQSLRAVAESKGIELNFVALGLANDEISQISDMITAFNAADFAFAYLTLRGSTDITQAFLQATRMAMTGGSTFAVLDQHVRLSEGSLHLTANDTHVYHESKRTSPWDLGALTAEEHFAEAQRGDDRASERVQLARCALDVIAELKLATEQVNGLVNKMRLDLRSAKTELESVVAETKPLVRDTIGKAEQALRPFVIRRVPCRAVRPTELCPADPAALVEDSSAIVGWIRRLVAELVVVDASLQAALHDAASSDPNDVKAQKRIYESSNNARFGQLSQRVNLTLSAAVTETAAEAPPTTGTASHSEEESASATLTPIVEKITSSVSSSWRNPSP